MLHVLSSPLTLTSTWMRLAFPWSVWGGGNDGGSRGGDGGSRGGDGGSREGDGGSSVGDGGVV